MKGPERLAYFEKNWPTNKGAWYPGEKVNYREMSLFGDFADKSWMTLLLYGITGELPSKDQAAMVEKLWAISTSFPDPRLWNNRVAALAGTTRSTGSLATSAATAISEAGIYGAKPLYLGAQFLREVASRVENGEKLIDVVVTRLKSDRVIPGFGRPIISKDERVAPLLAAADALGYGRGKYTELVKSIEEKLAEKRYRLKPNIAIFCAAILADLGYKPRESYLIAVLTFSAGIIPCFIDGEEKKEGALFPLRCSRIDYRGVEKRRYIDNENS